jgi:hypothetical protein
MESDHESSVLDRTKSAHILAMVTIPLHTPAPGRQCSEKSGSQPKPAACVSEINSHRANFIKNHLEDNSRDDESAAEAGEARRWRSGNSVYPKRAPIVHSEVL